MIDAISYIIAFVITIPFIPTWFVYFMLVKWGWPKLKAFHQAVNWTTLLYIIAVLLLIWVIFGVNLIGVFIIFFFAALAIIIFMQWKMNMEVLFSKALKLLWRISFLLFAFIYICLFTFDVAYRIFY